MNEYTYLITDVFEPLRERVHDTMRLVNELRVLEHTQQEKIINHLTMASAALANYSRVVETQPIMGRVDIDSIKNLVTTTETVIASIEYFERNLADHWTMLKGSEETTHA